MDEIKETKFLHRAWKRIGIILLLVGSWLGLEAGSVCPVRKRLALLTTRFRNVCVGTAAIILALIIGLSNRAWAEDVTITFSQFGQVGETQFYRDVEAPTDTNKSEVFITLTVTITETGTGDPATSAALLLEIAPSGPVSTTWTETDPGVSGIYDGIVDISRLLLHTSSNPHVYTVTIKATGAYSGASAPQDFKILGAGDLSGDGVVLSADAIKVVGSWTAAPGDPADYDPDYDLNRDGEIVIADFIKVLNRWTGPPKGLEGIPIGYFGPVTPTLDTPAHEATVSTSPTLSWNSSVSATSYTLEVSTDSTFQTFADLVVSPTGLTELSYDLSGLTASTSYWWRVNATGSDPSNPPGSLGTSDWSLVRKFTAEGGVVPPTVTTQAVSDIEETTATGNGNVTNTGGENCTERGFKYGLTETDTWSASDTGSFGAEAYTEGITGLDPGTQYHIRAFATNNSGMGYGSYVDFTTKPNQPTGLADTGRTATSINLNWTKGAGATNTMIRYRTDAYPTSPSNGTQAYYGTGTSGTVSPLSEGQIYYFRAWSYTADYSDDYASLTAYTRPGNPSALADSARTATSITMGWTTGAGADQTMVRYKTTGYPSSTSDGTQGYLDSASSSEIGSLSSGQIYYFRAWAYDIDSGYYSASYTEDQAYTLPGDPSALAATTDSSSQIDLSWTKGTGGDQTHIRRKEGSYPNDVTDGDQVYFDTGTSESDTELDPDTAYYYRAWAYDTDSDYYSAGYTEDTDTTAAPVPPTVSTDEATEVTTGSAQLNGTINPNGLPTTATFVWGLTTDYGNTTAEQYVGDGTSNVSISDTSLTTLSDDTTYHFAVVAINSIDTVTTGTDRIFFTFAQSGGVAPTAPSGLTAAAVSYSQIDLAWTDNADTEMGFYVYRNGLLHDTLAIANSESYSDTGLEAQTLYTYEVSAYNIAGESALSTDNSDTTPAAPGAAPNAPALTVVEAIGPGHIELTWTDVSNEDGYKIYRVETGLIATLIGVDITSYSDCTTAENTPYEYYVRAYNVVGDSSESNTAGATTPDCGVMITRPAAITAIAVSHEQIDIAWTDSSTNEDGFRIQYKDTLYGGTWNGPIITLPGAVTGTGSILSYSVTGLNPATTYYFRVGSYNENVATDWQTAPLVGGLEPEGATTFPLTQVPPNQIRLFPSAISVTAGQYFEVECHIYGPLTSVHGAAILVQYDKALFSYESITPGAPLTNLANIGTGDVPNESTLEFVYPQFDDYAGAGSGYDISSYGAILFKLRFRAINIGTGNIFVAADQGQPDPADSVIVRFDAPDWDVEASDCGLAITVESEMPE